MCKLPVDKSHARMKISELCAMAMAVCMTLLLAYFLLKKKKECASFIRTLTFLAAPHTQKFILFWAMISFVVEKKSKEGFADTRQSVPFPQL